LSVVDVSFFSSSFLPKVNPLEPKALDPPVVLPLPPNEPPAWPPPALPVLAPNNDGVEVPDAWLEVGVEPKDSGF
jgi:hypothetical protein